MEIGCGVEPAMTIAVNSSTDGTSAMSMILARIRGGARRAHGGRVRRAASPPGSSTRECPRTRRPVQERVGHERKLRVAEPYVIALEVADKAVLVRLRGRRRRRGPQHARSPLVDAPGATPQIGDQRAPSIAAEHPNQTRTRPTGAVFRLGSRSGKPRPPASTPGRTPRRPERLEHPGAFGGSSATKMAADEANVINGRTRRRDRRRRPTTWPAQEPARPTSGSSLWNTIAPVMLPIARVSLPRLTHRTLLSFSGSSVAIGAMTRASSVPSDRRARPTGPRPRRRSPRPHR